MVKIEELRVYDLAPNRRVVGWIFQPTADDLSGLSVEIYRSFSPEDDFEKIADVVFPQTYYSLARDAGPMVCRSVPRAHG